MAILNKIVYNEKRGTCLISANPLLTVNQVVKGFYVMRLEICPKMHVGPGFKIDTIFFLDRSNMGIITLIAQ